MLYLIDFLLLFSCNYNDVKFPLTNLIRMLPLKLACDIFCDGRMPRSIYKTIQELEAFKEEYVNYNVIRIEVNIFLHEGLHI